MLFQMRISHATYFMAFMQDTDTRKMGQLTILDLNPSNTLSYQNHVDLLGHFTQSVDVLRKPDFMQISAYI